MDDQRIWVSEYRFANMPDYQWRGYGYYATEAVAKEKLALEWDQGLKWYSIGGKTYARGKRYDGSIITFRLSSHHIETEKDVAELTEHRNKQASKATA